MKSYISIFLICFMASTCTKQDDQPTLPTPPYILKVTLTDTVPQMTAMPWASNDSTVRFRQLIHDGGAERIMRGDLYWTAFLPQHRGTLSYLLPYRHLKCSPYWRPISGSLFGIKADTLYVNPGRYIPTPDSTFLLDTLIKSVNPNPHSFQEQLILAKDSVIAFRQFVTWPLGSPSGQTDTAKFFLASLHPNEYNNYNLGVLGQNGFAIRTVGQSDTLKFTYFNSQGPQTETLVYP